MPAICSLNWMTPTCVSPSIRPRRRSAEHDGRRVKGAKTTRASRARKPCGKPTRRLRGPIWAGRRQIAKKRSPRRGPGKPPPGRAQRVLVVNSRLVHAGYLLLELDDTDRRLAVDQAEAALGRARRQARQGRENDASLAGQEAVREADEATARADLVRAQADLEKAQLDERRRQRLAGPGAISQQEMSDAQTATRVAQAAVSQARSRIAAAEAARTAAGGARRANQALFDDATIETNPEVVAAQARLNQARVDLARTVIRAPVRSEEHTSELQSLM